MIWNHTGRKWRHDFVGTFHQTWTFSSAFSRQSKRPSEIIMTLFFLWRGDIFASESGVKPFAQIYRWNSTEFWSTRTSSILRFSYGNSRRSKRPSKIIMTLFFLWRGDILALESGVKPSAQTYRWITTDFWTVRTLKLFIDFLTKTWSSPIMYVKSTSQ